VPDGSLYTRERIVTNAHGGLRDSLKAARRAARGSSVARAAVNPPNRAALVTPRSVDSGINMCSDREVSLTSRPEWPPMG